MLLIANYEELLANANNEIVSMQEEVDYYKKSLNTLNGKSANYDDAFSIYDAIRSDTSPKTNLDIYLLKLAVITMALNSKNSTEATAADNSAAVVSDIEKAKTELEKAKK